MSVAADKRSGPPSSIDVGAAGAPDSTLISCERDRVAASRVGKPIGLMFETIEQIES